MRNFEHVHIDTKHGPLDVIFINGREIRVEAPDRGYEHGVRAYHLLTVRGHEYQTDLCFRLHGEVWEAQDNREAWSRIKRRNGVELSRRQTPSIYDEIVKICHGALMEAVTPQRLHMADLDRAQDKLASVQDAFGKAQEVFQATSAARGEAATAVDLLTRQAKLNGWID